MFNKAGAVSRWCQDGFMSMDRLLLLHGLRRSLQGHVHTQVKT